MMHQMSIYEVTACIDAGFIFADCRFDEKHPSDETTAAMVSLFSDPFFGSADPFFDPFFGCDSFTIQGPAHGHSGGHGTCLVECAQTILLSLLRAASADLSSHINVLPCSAAARQPLVHSAAAAAALLAAAAAATGTAAAASASTSPSRTTSALAISVCEQESHFFCMISMRRPLK